MLFTCTLMFKVLLQAFCVFTKSGEEASGVFLLMPFQRNSKNILINKCCIIGEVLQSNMPSPENTFLLIFHKLKLNVMFIRALSPQRGLLDLTAVHCN